MRRFAENRSDATSKPNNPSGIEVFYSTRHVEEAWHHLMKSEDTARFKQIAVCNFDFLLAAVSALSRISIVDVCLRRNVIESSVLFAAATIPFPIFDLCSSRPFACFCFCFRFFFYLSRAPFVVCTLDSPRCERPLFAHLEPGQLPNKWATQTLRGRILFARSSAIGKQ